MKMRHRRLLKQRIAKHRWVLNHYVKSMSRVGDSLVEAFGLAANAAEGFANAIKKAFKEVARKMPTFVISHTRSIPHYRRHLRIPTWRR